MRSKIGLIAVVLLLALASSWWRFSLVWQWDWQTFWQDADALPIAQVAVKMSLLPEMAVAFLAGGLLSLASSALQQIVRNNLASDSTLAVGSGAQLVLMAAAVFFPTSELFGSFWIALMGALVAVLLVLFIATSRQMNPLSLILGGLIVNIVFGAMATLLTVFYFDFLFGIMVWGSGSLLQDGWNATIGLMWLSVSVTIAFLLLHKPLTLLSLDDKQARRLGAPVTLLRYIVLLLCATITAFVVSRVGVIGFIGLAGASCAHFLGVRHFIARLFTAFVAGGLLLFFTNNLIGIVGTLSQTLLPVGAFTASLGAPLLIFLVLKQRKNAVEPISTATRQVLKRMTSWRLPLLALSLLLLATIVLQGFAPTIDGWQWLWDGHLIAEHRLPRSLSAIATGAMLAVGGSLLQTLTRNPMASPEVLGVSSGAAMSIVIAFLLVPTLSVGGLLLAGMTGSLLILWLVIWLSRRLQPAALMLVGVAVGALVGSVMAVIQLSANPRLNAVMSWLSGSTYYAQPHSAWVLLGLAMLLIALAMLLVKPLRLLSLGETVSHHLGLSVKTAQGWLLLLVALMSAAATLAVGPLSFIGLMTPHLARGVGAITPDKQLPIAALFGALLMLFADWLGRYLVFPYEIGAGVIASILGGIYFLLLLKQRR